MVCKKVLESVHRLLVSWGALVLVPSGCPRTDEDGTDEPVHASESLAHDHLPGEPEHWGSGKCVHADRPLGFDERFEKWPSPNDIEQTVNRTFSGTIRWETPEAHASNHIDIDIRVDVQKLALRYVTERPGPGNRIICQNFLVVPLQAILRVNGAKFELTQRDVCSEKRASMRGHLSSTFASALGAQCTDGCEVGLQVLLNGDALMGWFDMTGGSENARLGSFVLK